MPEGDDAAPHLSTFQAIGLLVIWLSFSCFYATSPLDERQIYFGGDQSLLLRAADETLQGRPPLVGALSRGALFHPGPLFVYLLAVVQAVTGHRESLSIAVVSWLQAGTIPLLSLLTFRLSRSFSLAAWLPFFFVFNYPFLFYMRILWNVSIVVPALALAFWLALDADRPAPWFLPALAATLSLVAQAHMGFLPLAVWLGVAALGRIVLTRRPFPIWTLLLTFLVLAVSWTPVLLDAARHHGGNLGKLVAYFASAHQRQPAREVLETIDRLAAEGLLGGPWTRRALLVTPFALLALARLRRDTSARRFRWFLLLLAGSWVTLLWSIGSIPGQIQTYCLRPLCVLVAATVIGGTAAFLSLISGTRARVLLAWILTGLVIGLSVGPALEMRRRFSDVSWNTYPISEMRVITSVIATLAGSASARQVDLEFGLEDLAGAEEPILYLLARQGIERVHGSGVPAFRLTLVSAPRPPGEPRWARAVETERYRLEVQKPALR